MRSILEIDKELVREAGRVSSELRRGARRPRARNDAVHEARKGYKRLRSLLRLARPAIGKGAFDRQNRFLRDLSRELSGARDAAVLLELARQYGGRRPSPAALGLRNELRSRRDTALARLPRALRASGELAAKMRRRHVGRGQSWKCTSDALAGIYRRARRAARVAESGPNPANLHELRKQAKYLRYSHEYLRSLWPEEMKFFEERLHELTDALGEHQDLTVLRDLLCERAPEKRVMSAIDRRRGRLVEVALASSARLFAEKPGAFRRRIQGYHQAWQLAKKARN